MTRKPTLAQKQPRARRAATLAQLYALNVIGAHTRFAPGRTNKQLCTAQKRNGTPCRMLALSGLKVCGVHGGYGVKAKAGLYVGKRQRPAFQCDEGDAPERRELYALDIWRKPMTQRERLALTTAFDNRATAPDVWRKAVQDASR